jgi:hypothetical protein
LTQTAPFPPAKLTLALSAPTHLHTPRRPPQLPNTSPSP